MNWHYMDGDKQIGPLTVEEIGALIEADKLTEDTLVWNETLSDWTRLIDSGLVETEESSPTIGQSKHSSKSPVRESPARKTSSQKVMESFSVSKKRIAIFILSLIGVVGGLFFIINLDKTPGYKIVPRGEMRNIQNNDNAVTVMGAQDAALDPKNEIQDFNDAAARESYTDDRSNIENMLRKKAGQDATFEIIAELSFDDFPNLKERGMAAYEILLWSFRSDKCSTRKELSGLWRITKSSGQRSLGRAILVTTETSFKSKGDARMSVIEGGTCQIKDANGFSNESMILVEARTSDILAYQAAQKETQPLFDLIKKKDIETLKKYLADNKVNMEAETIQGKTALMLAIDYCDNEQLFDLLLQHGANINARSSSGDYPLLYAIQRKREKATMLLLERGANQNVLSEAGQGALELAIRKKSPSSIIDKLSQKKGTDVNEMIDNMPMLCWYIKRDRYDEALKLLGAGADPNAVCNTPDRSSPLILASSKRRGEPVVQALLSAGAKIDYQKQYGSTALQMAVYYGHPKIISLLGRHGADVNIQTDQGLTALMLCLIKRFTPQVEAEIVKELCLLKPNVNLKESHKNTALHYAVLNKREEALRALLAGEADVNVQNENGDTPLHLAAKAGLTEFIKLLLRFDARKDIKNNDGLTPYRVASSNAKMDAAEMLK